MTKIEANIARAGINKFGFMRITDNGTSYVTRPIKSVIDMLREYPERIDYRVEFATKEEYDKQEIDKLVNKKPNLN